jgi:hypothetical protein
LGSCPLPEACCAQSELFERRLRRVRNGTFYIVYLLVNLHNALIWTLTLVVIQDKLQSRCTTSVLMYAFLSNEGLWELRHSLVIDYTAVGEQGILANFRGSVSLRQYLSVLARAGSISVNTTNKVNGVRYT